MTFGMLRVKNEARWIERVLQSLQGTCDRVLVLDDHSTDETVALCEANGATVFPSPFEGIHEARDKDYLLERVWEAGAQIGDYCVMVDGDEAIDPEGVSLLNNVIAEGVVECGSMHIVYLWNTEQQIRVDRWYKGFTRPSMFKLTRRDLSFKITQFGGNFHCSSAPAQLLSSITPLAVRLLHYGYLHAFDRIRKYHWYNTIDPNNDFEDCYRHMVIGDLFPKDTVCKWAGPLELVAL